MPETLIVDAEVASGAALLAVAALSVKLTEAGVLTQKQVSDAISSAIAVCRDGGNDPSAQLLEHVFELPAP